jgi:hypothetical protein
MHGVSIKTSKNRASVVDCCVLTLSSVTKHISFCSKKMVIRGNNAAGGRRVNFAASPGSSSTSTPLAWRSDSADGRYLHSLLETNAIDGMTPKEVQTSFARFMKYNNNSFASNLRRLRLKTIGQAQGANGIRSKYCFWLIVDFFIYF